MTLHVWPTPDAEEQILEIGKRYLCPVANVRRLRIKRTPYHIYYVPKVDEGEVVVVAVWSGTREHGPPIRLP